MEENNENKANNNVEEPKIINVEEVKEQTDDNVESNQASQNTDFKKEANEAKNFFVDFFKSPLSQMKKIVSTPKSFLKVTIILLVAWVVFECLGSIIGIVNSYSYSPYYSINAFIRNSISDFFDVFFAILIPVASVAALSFIIYLLMREKKKNYLTIAATVIIAKTPVIIASLVSLLGYINSQVKIITSTFSDFCYVISTVLIYFAVKALYSEDDDNTTTKTFLIAMAIFFVVVLVLRFFGIDMYC